MDSLTVGKLQVQIYESTAEMAKSAARQVAERIKALLVEKPELNIVFSGALSQQAFHRALAAQTGIKWNRINCFSVDEFYCPGINPECAVAAQPKRDLYSKVTPKSVNTIRFDAPDPEAECLRYERLITENPLDIACLGIGVSGHIAFNEPGQTDFNDQRKVKVIKVTAESKRQLMNDPNFQKLSVIPDLGITITISELMRCPYVFVIVPYAEKAPIIKRLLESDSVTVEFPATILKEKEGAVLYLDAESYSLYKKEH